MYSAMNTCSEVLHKIVHFQWRSYNPSVPPFGHQSDIKGT